MPWRGSIPGDLGVGLAVCVSRYPALSRPGERTVTHAPPAGLVIQRAVKEERRRARITKPARCHTLLHSFATHLRKKGYDIRPIQELLSHKDVTTAMIHTHALNKGSMGVKSPLGE